MTASTTSTTPIPTIPMTPNLFGLSIPELCQMWLEIKAELNSLDADHNESGAFENPVLTRQYRHMRAPLETLATSLKEVLYPHYLEECQADRQEAERLNNLGGVVVALP